MKIGFGSNVGKKRDLDEDSIIVVRNETVSESKREQVTLLIVADGMGGHNAGEVASRLATAKVAEEVVGAMFKENRRDLFEKREKNPLKIAIEEANNYIFNEVKEDPQYEGMGTTVTAAVILGPTVYIGHVGDSRAYIVNEEEIRQVTKDHSLVQEMVKRGEIIEMCNEYFLKNKTTEVSRITAKIKAMLSHIVDIHRLTRNIYVDASCTC